MNEHVGHALLVRIRYLEGRYHGRPEWPPSPGRLFQALVAGTGRAGSVPQDGAPALRWLEELRPPWVGAPRARVAQKVTYYVPNNDLDAPGRPELVDKVRTAKVIEPRLFSAEIPLFYLWWVEDADDEVAAYAERLADLALDLYQLGRGIDPAWAEVEWLTGDEARELVAQYRGTWHRPSRGSAGRGRALPCPAHGSLASLEVRFQATLARFEREGRKTLFRQPPKPHFREVRYDCAPERQLFELRSTRDPDRMAPHAQSQVVALVEAIRDGLADRLTRALPEQATDVERMIVGRTPEGSRRLAVDQRVRLIPLPSIGHRYADRSVRRVLVEIPSGGPVQAGDVLWGISGAIVSVRPELWSDECEACLVPAAEREMLRHYGLGSGGPTARARGARVWRTVTPAVLPKNAARRRLEPSRPQHEPKGGAERANEEARALGAVRAALRHAGIQEDVAAIRVQRESYEENGQRAEPFAAGTRFAKERLWHAEVEFCGVVEGPLVIGDGRFLGLGVMAPVRDRRGIALHAVALGIEEGWSEHSDALEVARALRRAILARVQDVSSERDLPATLTGHGDDGSPLKGHAHVHFVCDPVDQVLLIVPGPIAMRSTDPSDRRDREAMNLVERACEGFVELRAGRSGRLGLIPVQGGVEFPIGRRWSSRTLYTVRRHPRGVGAEDALRQELLAECAELGLPRPEVEVRRVRSIANVGLSGEVLLTFTSPICGPLALGRTRHKGGGWFGVEDSVSA